MSSSWYHYFCLDCSNVQRKLSDNVHAPDTRLIQFHVFTLTRNTLLSTSDLFVNTFNVPVHYRAVSCPCSSVSVPCREVSRTSLWKRLTPQQNQIRVIDRQTTTMSSRDKKLKDFGDKKKVHWAVNLEQIKYFSPNLERQEPGSKAAKNATITKINPQDRGVLHWMQKMAERHVKKLIPGHSSEINFEDLTDLYQHRDYCFELNAPWELSILNC